MSAPESVFVLFIAVPPLVWVQGTRNQTPEIQIPLLELMEPMEVLSLRSAVKN